MAAGTALVLVSSLYPAQHYSCSPKEHSFPLARYVPFSLRVIQKPCIIPRSSSSSSSSSSRNKLDENLAIQDMELYLNDISLEYENVWDTKPAWCQPWTIVLTGCACVLTSWLLFHSVIGTTAVAAAISAWWFVFLYSYPQEYKRMIAERRKQITDGNEDT